MSIFQQGMFRYDSSRDTPETIAQKRAIIAKIMGSQNAPKTIGDGLNALGDGIVANVLGQRAEAAETAGQSAASDLRSQFADWLTGQGTFPAAPNPGDSTAMADMPAPDYASARVAQAHGDSTAPAGNWLSYSNQGATRNLPISENLQRAMSFLPELGVTMDVYSGGQPARGTSSRRVGSTRHDHGNAADVTFRDASGRMLDWNTPADIPTLQAIVQRARASGVTGFGAGNDYMGAGRMHIGFGNPGVWGAGGRGVNAPEWLVQAYNTPYERGGAAAAVEAMGTGGLPQSFLGALDRAEGGGNYDTLFGHAQRDGGRFAGTRVSQMPISDVLAFADPRGAYGQHVKRQVGRVATPMGRGQIVGTTLRNVVGELGIDPSTPFNADTQHQIMGHLARRRIAGASTMDGKIAGLRSEWGGFKSVPRAQMEQIVRDIEASPANAVAANEAMATGGPSNGLTPDALQQWAFANYAPQPANGAVDAVNSLADGSLPDPAQWPEIQRRAMTSEPADPATWPQRQAALMRETSPQWLNDTIDAAGVPVAETEADILAQEQAMAAQDPMAFQPSPGTQSRIAQSLPMQQPAPPMPAPQTVQDRPVAPVQMAQAGGFPEMAGRDPSRPPPPDFNMLMQVMGNPFMDEGTKAFAQAQLQQYMQSRDPMRQADLAYKQAQTQKLQREAASGNTTYGLNPIYGQDSQGNTVLGVLGNDGSFKPVDTGGVNVSTGVDRVDLGTHFGLLDKRSGQMVGTLPKNNYTPKFDETSGSEDAKRAAAARADLPKVEDNANAILGMIQSLSTDPYLDSMVGPVSGRLPNISGDAARVQSKMDQIGGQAFLQAFETLRGGGQISNVEGERATAALARLNTAQSPQDYRKALDELSAIVRTSLDRARRSAGAGSGNNPPPGASGDGWQDMGGVRIRRKQ